MRSRKKTGTRTFRDRESLRDAAFVREYDYHGVNPRKFIRYLDREIEDITVNGTYKYTTTRRYGGDKQKLIDSETIGDTTGFIDAEIDAELANDPPRIGAITFTYHPYLVPALALIAVGLLVLLGGTMQNAWLYILGGGLIALGGGYLGLQTDTDTVPVKLHDHLTVKIEGDVSERTVTEDASQTTTHTDLYADLTVTFAVEYLLCLDTATISTAAYPFRHRVKTVVEDWFAETADAAVSSRVTIPSADDDTPIAQRIADFQAQLAPGRDPQAESARRAYNECLRSELDTDVESEVTREIDALQEAVETLAEDLEAHIEK